MKSTAIAILQVTASLLIIAGSICVGRVIERVQHTCPEPALNSVGQVLLLSQAEVQKQLIEIGYDIGPNGLDGWIGPDSRKAWNTAYGNQCAAEYFPKD